MTRSLWLLPALAALFADPASAQVQPYALTPGEVVFSDTAGGSIDPAVRVLGRDGQVRTLLEGGPLFYPSGVMIDRDGAVLVLDYHSQSSPNNALLRLPPEGGTPQRLNQQALQDCFTVARGGDGQLYVADGFAGVQEILPDGQVVNFWPGTQAGFPIAFGLSLLPGGELLSTEAPQASTAEKGGVYRLDAQGQASTVYRDAATLRSPQDITLAPNGNLFLTHYDQYNPGQEAPRLVRIRGIGTADILVDGLPLQKPKGIACDAFGQVVIADTDAKGLWRWDEQHGLRALVQDADDGVLDGKPVNRPFDAAIVPALWLRAPHQPVAGQDFTLILESVETLGGHPVGILVDHQRIAFPLEQLFPGSPRTLALDPNSADLFTIRMPALGAPVTLQRSVPPGMAGLALHLQAFEPRKQIPSPEISFRVN